MLLFTGDAMKYLSLLFQSILLTFVQNTTLGQASFLLANDIPIDAPVYDAAGNPLEGSDYLVELWGATSSNSLAPAVDVNHGFAREIIPFGIDGYFFSSAGSLSVVDVPPNGYAWLQVRAWDARLGTTYEGVEALRIGGYGESTLFYAQGSDPYAEPPRLPAPLIGLESFNLRPIIPEPCAGPILLLGLPLLLRLRHHRHGTPRLI